MIRIAGWSGPRNISTAMMRAWENRPDTVVVDEPLYAYYLATSGSPHPGREEVIAAGEPDWQEALRKLEEPLPAGVGVQYEKHMTHHILPEVDLGRLAGCRHFFLIRHPADVLRSYRRKRQQVSAADLGFVQQERIHAQLARVGRPPPVVDARELRDAPQALLRALCAALEVPFDHHMLAWPPGPRASDGVWARHWYDAVWRSTGFLPCPPAPRESLAPELQAILDACLPAYERLAAQRLRPA